MLSEGKVVRTLHLFPSENRLVSLTDLLLYSKSEMKRVECKERKCILEITIINATR